MVGPTVALVRAVVSGPFSGRITRRYVRWQHERTPVVGCSPGTNRREASVGCLGHSALGPGVGIDPRWL
jgi:hypothetical protein